MYDNGGKGELLRRAYSVKNASTPPWRGFGRVWLIVLGLCMAAIFPGMALGSRADGGYEPTAELVGTAAERDLPYYDNEWGLILSWYGTGEGMPFTRYDLEADMAESDETVLSDEQPYAGDVLGEVDVPRPTDANGCGLGDRRPECYAASPYPDS